MPLYECPSCFKDVKGENITDVGGDYFECPECEAQLYTSEWVRVEP